MTEKYEIRARSMELALKFISVAYKLPITNELANSTGYSEQELDRVFKDAVDLSEKFEKFIKNAP